jgi:hypothetical protein
MYRKHKVGTLGELQFLGNFGAVALFEDAVGDSFLSRFSNTKPRIGDLIKISFYAYKVACKRQEEKQKYSLEDFEDNVGKELIELSGFLLNDMLKELGLDNDQKEETPQKKIAKAK